LHLTYSSWLPDWRRIITILDWAAVVRADVTVILFGENLTTVTHRGYAALLISGTLNAY